MRERNVGIDFHSTLVNFNTFWWEEVERRMGFKRGTLKPPTEFGLGNYHRKVQSQVRNLFTDATYMMDIKNAKFVNLFLQWAKHRGNNIYIVTATPQNLRNRVENYIFDQWEQYIDSVYYVGLGEEKTDIFKKLNLTYWIDDNEKECLRAYNNGLFTFLISNDLTPWNKFFEHDLIVKVRSLYKIIEYFKGV